ncbi:MAG TPA: hypothetical protein VJ874_03590, partial [Candidatus Thermoplasmatota archaeon]|nr:hypothetical protein [Candidatus Thermoplasmatota archaeon]
MRPTVPFVAFAMLLLAGCFGGPDGCVPPVSASDAPADAPSVHTGPGPQVAIRVLSAVDDTPLAGAGVAVLWNTERIEEPDGNESTAFPENPPLTVVYLRTDPDGRAAADVVDDRYFMVVAASEGFTEEWSELQVPGSAASSNHVLRLYPQRMDWQVNGSLAMDPMADAWHPHPFPYSGSAAVGHEQASRLIALDVALDWQVGAGEVADLALVVGDDGSGGQRMAYTGPHLAPGRYHESLALTRDDLASFDGPGFLAGPQVVRPDVHVQPIAYTVTATATFDHRAVEEAECGTLFPDS